MLAQAESNVGNDWERDFCAGLREKFMDYGGGMFFSDKQNAVLHRIAGVPYQKQAEEPREEKAKFDWDDFRSSFEQPPPGQQHRPAEPDSVTITKDFVKRLLHLCHPDKHGNSNMATSVTQELLKLRGTR